MINIGHGVCSKTLASSSRLGKSYTMFFVHRASVKPILVSPLKAVDYLCFIYNSGNRQIFLKLIFPLSIPTIIETAKLAVPASIIGATMGEWLGTRNGIGHLITVSLYQLNPGVLYASLAAIMFSSIISIFALSVIGKIVTPWVIKN